MIGQNCLPTPLVANFTKAAGDFPQRLIPGNTFELLATPGTAPAQGVLQTRRVINALGKSPDLAANKPAGGGMIVPTTNARDLPIPHLDLQGTSVRAVHRAGGLKFGGGRRHLLPHTLRVDLPVGLFDKD